MTQQKPYTPAGQCVTINWKAKYNYVPASELPEIKAKHDYYINRRWNDKPMEPVPAEIETAAFRS